MPKKVDVERFESRLLTVKRWLSRGYESAAITDLAYNFWGIDRKHSVRLVARARKDFTEASKRSVEEHRSDAVAICDAELLTPGLGTKEVLDILAMKAKLLGLYAPQQVQTVETAEEEHAKATAALSKVTTEDRNRMLKLLRKNAR